MLGLKLEGARRNLWRFRVGEYRLIAERKKTAWSSSSSRSPTAARFIAET
jgi:hypothetical protein